ncbi:hypothetical protein [Halanaerobacter jeridensis]|uniref:Uncharacterized protein n=1 Tax=Halanaerobacter jeridensis TaxID=706427 RepID=A0A939BNW1_9FIRM|nr:hypothetical protein [Halanaerobacter jeridensis]MBM7556162.1 hypothetical protein [Halanaerobacter jeridensis]
MGVQVTKLNSQKCDIDASVIKNNTNRRDVPGHLAVQVDNCQLSPEEYTLYGVNTKGGMTSGTGVQAVDTITDQNNNFFLLFNIKELRTKEQLDDRTIEIVIKTNGHELGRDTINDVSGIYLG